jgi:uncharacterized repeat protein (TIGR01451 family)
MLACDPRAPIADLAMTQSAAQSGQNVSYTLTVTNNGPCVAHNVTIQDTLPPGFVFISFQSISPGTWQCTPSEGNVVLCVLESLGQKANGGGPGVVAILAQPPGPGGDITNRAVVGANETDPDCTPSFFCSGTGSDNESWVAFVPPGGGEVSTGIPTPRNQTTSLFRPSAGSVLILQVASAPDLPPPPCNPCNGNLVLITTPPVPPQFMTFTFNVPAPPGEPPSQVQVFHVPDGGREWLQVGPCPGDPCLQSVQLVTPNGALPGYFKIVVLSSSNGGWGNR